MQNCLNLIFGNFFRKIILKFNILFQFYINVNLFILCTKYILILLISNVPLTLVYPHNPSYQIKKSFLQLYFLNYFWNLWILLILRGWGNIFPLLNFIFTGLYIFRITFPNSICLIKLSLLFIASLSALSLFLFPYFLFSFYDLYIF